jgi:hypothetical protein
MPWPLYEGNPQEMSWFTITEIKTEGTTLRLRFCPADFMHDHSAPVTEVVIEVVEAPEDAVAALDRFRTEYIVDFSIESGLLRLTSDFDYEETVVKCREASSRYVEYSVSELKSIVVHFEKALREESAESLRTSSKLRNVRHFVEDLVERAEKKRAMSERRHDGIESQLAVLRRVLNRFDDA